MASSSPHHHEVWLPETLSARDYAYVLFTAQEVEHPKIPCLVPGHVTLIFNKIHPNLLDNGVKTIKRLKPKPLPLVIYRGWDIFGGSRSL